MKLRDWSELSDLNKRLNVCALGTGLNWEEIQNSMDYLNAVINRLIYIREVQKLPRYGMKAIAETLRWESMASDGSVLFKVNNNLSADINHFLLRAFPELEGFLSCRSKV